MWRVVVLFAVGCTRGPTDAELDHLRTEAVAANQAAVDAAGKASSPGFSLTVSGQLGKPGATLAWPELRELATATVETVDAQNPDRKQPTTFRGVLVRDLLDRFAASADADETTFV